MWPIERKAIWKSIMDKVNILNIRLKHCISNIKYTEDFLDALCFLQSSYFCMSCCYVIAF